MWEIAEYSTHDSRLYGPIVMTGAAGVILFSSQYVYNLKKYVVFKKNVLKKTVFLKKKIMCGCFGPWIKHV